MRKQLVLVALAAGCSRAAAATPLDDGIFWSDSHPSPLIGEPRFGVAEYRFDLDAGASLIEISFLRPLNGARVDVTLIDDDWSEAVIASGRETGASLYAEWPHRHARFVRVTIHRHLRPLPRVTRWRAGTRRTGAWR